MITIHDVKDSRLITAIRAETAICAIIGMSWRTALEHTCTLSVSRLLDEVECADLAELLRASLSQDGFAMHDVRVSPRAWLVSKHDYYSLVITFTLMPQSVMA